jgi:hypothetical protein
MIMSLLYFTMSCPLSVAIMPKKRVQRNLQNSTSLHFVSVDEDDEEDDEEEVSDDDDAWNP